MYAVVWRIEVDAESTLEAAKEALKIQRDRSSEALFFEVTPPDDGDMVDVDLSDFRDADENTPLEYPSGGLTSDIED